MSNKILLKHPEGKKAVSIDALKYDMVKNSVLNYLHENRGVTQSEIVAAVQKDFKAKKIKFEGSLPWYTEWVKLDLEARKQIKRDTKSTPQTYTAVKKR